MRNPTHSIDHVEPNHLHWFISGAVHEWNTGSQAGLGDQNLQNYVIDSVEKVTQFLRGVRDLDGSFSDLQCGLALEAKKLFKPVPINL